LRSVVLVPPPGAPRRTVVLRAGGPQDKGKGADVAAGVIGAILLLACIVLVVMLPHKDYAMPQFRLRFNDTTDDTTYGTQEFDFRTTAGGARQHDFTYQLPDDTQAVTVVVEFTDDVPASLPDHFTVEMTDPNGNPVGVKYDIVNDPPTHDANPQDWLTNPGLATAWNATLAQQRYPFALADHPQEKVVPGLSHTEVKEQALARLAPQYRLHTAGTYTVRVKLVEALGCPQPAPDTDANQVAACRNEQPNGEDTGNLLRVTQFIFTTIKPVVEDLK